MGTWHLVVIHHSSNWKELQTLLLTLERLRGRPRTDLEGTTVFYFTDNMVTYFIVASGASRSPQLHSLILSIKLLEMELGITLVVVHVPGVVMIKQGTDGQSQGVWTTPLHAHLTQTAINAAIFAPMVFDYPWTQQFLHLLFLESSVASWRYQPWESRWNVNELFDCLTVWCPPPEMARQAIVFELNAWME